MRRVVTGVTSILTAQAGTALSPEWDHGFDEAFTDLVTSDPDLLHDEFDAIIGANFGEPPAPPAPAAPSDARPAPPSAPRSGIGDSTPAPAGDQHPDPTTNQRSPP